MRTKRATISKVAELKKTINKHCDSYDDCEWIWEDIEKLIEYIRNEG